MRAERGLRRDERVLGAATESAGIVMDTVTSLTASLLSEDDSEPEDLASLGSSMGSLARSEEITACGETLSLIQPLGSDLVAGQAPTESTRGDKPAAAGATTTGSTSSSPGGAHGRSAR